MAGRLPLKLADGVKKYEPLEFRTNRPWPTSEAVVPALYSVPLIVNLLTVSTSASRSKSFGRTLPERLESSVPDLLSLPATGASLTAARLMVSSWLAVATPSVMVIVATGTAP